MANTRSAKKAIRKIEYRTKINRIRRSRVRTFIRRVNEAVANNDKAVANDALKAAQPEIMRAVTKGVLKPGTAARKFSRLVASVKKISIQN